MRVKPTDKWINSIAVPNCGIIRKPFNSGLADVSDDVGNWLIEAGFAIAAETEVAIEIPESSLTQVQEPLLLSEKSAPTEPVKTKKSSKLFVNPGES